MFLPHVTNNGHHMTNDEIKIEALSPISTPRQKKKKKKKKKRKERKKIFSERKKEKKISERQQQQEQKTTTTFRYKITHTRELISARTTSHKYNNKDLSCLR